MSFVAGIGGANVDTHGSSIQPVILRDSNPGHLHLSLGGVMRNILENLSRLGTKTAIFSVVGDDSYGKMLREGCNALGMDTTHLKTLAGHRSSSYVSILDHEGDMLVAMSDMAIIKQMGAEFVLECLPLLQQAELVVCDANLSVEALTALAEHCSRPLMLDPVSTSWAKSMAHLAGAFHTIKPNRMELEALTGTDCSTLEGVKEACSLLLQKGCKRLFVSMGADGLYYQDDCGNCIHQTTRPFAQICNATGAGDATMAGIVYAGLQGLSPLKTVQFGMGAGLCALSAADTIDLEISTTKIEQMVKEYLL